MPALGDHMASLTEAAALRLALPPPPGGGRAQGGPHDSSVHREGQGYGLLAGIIEGGTNDTVHDPRLFWNIAAPSSFFICGSQGSGKSHTLSCLLENALAHGVASVLRHPLTGLVFHYDTFNSDSGGSPCEAAYLSSNSAIKVRVLCPPTNIRTMKRLYSQFPNITVEELRLSQGDLNTKRMLDLMAVSNDGPTPLYLAVNTNDEGFNYTEFKKRLENECLTKMQLGPLRQRLELLESFMVKSHAKTGTDWTPQSGLLTIVDLSCPCVTAETACSLFNICLSLFLEQDSALVGRVVALDEAHKYMVESAAESAALTEALLATIRLQRHLGTRVLVSTQEPTISPKLLDLCSCTIVHRFTLPAWLSALKQHLAGVSSGAKLLDRAALSGLRRAGEWDVSGGGDGAMGGLLGSARVDDPALELFPRIVGLRVGEALLFAPSAIIGVARENDVSEASDGGGGGGLGEVKRLGRGVPRVRIRNRTMADGGRSVMAA
ncbi:hypothetical protein B0H63DRAFT_496751 [Podospora didyma]|uniref:AAA+ ATPase domain-containing protein n=1 Tax=Podospora didyma TaxID=330526 RepID=A0AAE0N627_9PEZI|nr:hypothetical protein B0H63DRAFT_496751 [Podospora didyma]